MNKQTIIAGLVGVAAGIAIMRYAELATDQPLYQPQDACDIIGTMPPKTFTAPGSTLVIPELTGFECQPGGVIHWRHIG